MEAMFYLFLISLFAWIGPLIIVSVYNKLREFL